MQQIARGRELAAQLAEHISLEGARVLDVGCQTGGLAIALAARNAKVTGVGVDATLLRAAEIRARCHGVDAQFVVAKSESLPFESNRFDLVTFVDVIEHVERANDALAEVARVLAPGGLLYLQGPNRFSPRWFLRDPHYQMTGISVLPPDLGRWYVTRVRKRPRYDVGVFPVGARVLERLERAGLEIETPARPNGLAQRTRQAIALRFGSMFIVQARKPAR